MSAFYHGAHFSNFQPQNPHPMPQSHNHHGRSRRAPRLSASQNSHRQYRGPKNIKEAPVVEAPNVSAYRARFEAGRSFDLEDDLEFCPNLLTNDEVHTSSHSMIANRLSCGLVSEPEGADFWQRQSIYSGSSDRSSLSSGSPDSSPQQHQIQPQQIAPAVNVSAAAVPAFVSPPNFLSNMANNNTSNNLQIHQPSPYRVRKGIPIVDPNNRSRVASPPSSISPGVMHSTTAARGY